MTLKKATAALAGLALAFASPLAANAVDNYLTGSLIDEAPHELPAPAVSVNSDGVSLVAWLGQDPTVTDGDPDTAGDQVCSSDGGVYCDIVFTLVDSEGTALTDVTAISPTDVRWYYSAPSIYWNETLGEWLVLMTNYYETNQQAIGVWGQRVDVDGDLIGGPVELPATSVTRHDNRNEAGILDISDTFGSPVQVQARWSDEDSAYFVTWYASANELSGFEFDGDVTSQNAIFGIFLNNDLSVTDGIDAAFVVSKEDPIRCCNLSIGYSSEINEWAVAWVKNVDQDYVWASVSNPQAPEVSASNVVVDRELYNTNDRPIPGGLVWFDSEQAWFTTFGWETEVPGLPEQLEELNGAEQGLFGRWLGLDGSLSDIVLVDDGTETFFDAQNADAPVEVIADYFYRQTMDIDPVTGYVHITYGKQFYNVPDSNDEDTVADNYRHLAYYMVYDPVAGEVIESSFLSSDFPAQSSRPQVDIGCSSGAIVYQDWSNGDWEGPAGVRFVGIDGVGSCEPVLAHTGATVDGLALAGLFAVVAGAGVYAVRRRARA